MPRIITRTNCRPREQCSWQLRRDSVHLWRINLTDLPALDATVLSDEEQRRAQRFRFEKDRRRYIGRRVVLRELLAKYEKLPAESIVFQPTEFGKPLALDAEGQQLVQFSSTSRDHLVLVGIAHAPLGVDIECMRRAVDLDVMRFFHGLEAADIQARVRESQLPCFFHCWARKEAYVKALGMGLHLPLNRFRVSVDPNVAQLLWRDPEIGDTAQWTMHSIQTDDDYAGALVVEPKCANVECYEFK